MLIEFFYALRAAKLPVSVKELLALLQALDAGVIGPRSEGGWSLDDFYFIARTVLVKDEKHYDKFDRAFAAYFKGVEMLADFTKELPLEWLRKNLELELSPEDKAKIEKIFAERAEAITACLRRNCARESAPARCLARCR
jgi:uncharacterized protein with von Willebrand factor type A (vWA) domain